MEKGRAMKYSEVKTLLEKLPKAELGFFPTPFYKLGNLSKELGVNLYIKRDDFTGMNLFGGNKVRKLQYLIGDALSQGCEYVFTFGATQSNHAMQTVSVCRRCGLKPVLYLVALVEPDKEDMRSNLLLDHIMGAEIHIVNLLPGEEEADAEKRSVQMAREHMKRLESDGHKCYEVPMGGASPMGSVGFIEGFGELMEQAKDLIGKEPDYIYHATGTGGTMAGLLAGRALLGFKVPIISIHVSWKDSEYPGRCGDLANESLKLLGIGPLVDGSRDSRTDLNYYQPGYEIPNEEASNAIRLLARKEGLLVDPVYTGKAFAGLLDHIKTGKVKQGSDVVFLHTGGATALFAEKEILGQLF
jgi:L-cysteate sulfo-lyase